MAKVAEATVDEVVEAVRENPGQPREFYVGYLGTYRRMNSARRAIRRAIREGRVEVFQQSSHILRLPKSAMRE